MSEELEEVIAIGTVLGALLAIYETGKLIREHLHREPLRQVKAPARSYGWDPYAPGDAGGVVM